MLFAFGRQRDRCRHAAATVVRAEGLGPAPAKPPSEEVFAAFAEDLGRGVRQQDHTRLGLRAEPRQSRHVRACSARSGRPQVDRHGAALQGGQFLKIDKRVGRRRDVGLIKRSSPPDTPRYFLRAHVDVAADTRGRHRAAAGKRTASICFLFVRTVYLSDRHHAVAVCCSAIRSPICSPICRCGQANLLMILVLLPFWTSLLVRTSAWKVLLQQQGVINDLLVWLGIIDNEQPAATDQQPDRHDHRDDAHPAAVHDPAALLGDEDDLAVLYARGRVASARPTGRLSGGSISRRRCPGIGAGAILVFILAIGYYITPELVGGTSRHVHLEPDRLPHLDIAATGDWRPPSARSCSAW